MKQMIVIGIVFIFISFASAGEEDIPTPLKISPNTETCLSCHREVTPGIVGDWRSGRHSLTTPSNAVKMNRMRRRISVENPPDDIKDFTVGCAECHTMNPDSHKDTFEHNGFMVHIVVSPSDCAVCHPVEDKEYSDNIMRFAYGNLMNNPVYKSLMDSINAPDGVSYEKSVMVLSRDLTDADSCLFCHGTKMEVGEIKARETSMGEMSFPVLKGWPNQGVGRINPDGSIGSCTSCHPRHQFSISMAREPDACLECHTGPDVPAGRVYEVSKHGNIYNGDTYHPNYDVPWIIGEDFNAPTCAMCHMSQIVSTNGSVIAERTHRVNDRLPWRIFGPIYAHPHPISPDTSIIKNSMNLPLPVNLDGTFASQYLIDEEEQNKRRETMQSVCRACHAETWIDGHFQRFENTIKTSNEITLDATKILMDCWTNGYASGLDKNDSIFNESIEKMWVEQWLFYANSTRFASAMGGADYGVFANGRWYMSKNLEDMKSWVELRTSGKK